MHIALIRVGAMYRSLPYVRKVLHVKGNIDLHSPPREFFRHFIPWTVSQLPAANPFTNLAKARKETAGSIDPETPDLIWDLYEERGRGV